MRKIIYCLLFIVLTQSVNAQETYNLQQVLEIGLERNYDIRIVRNEQKTRENNATIGNAGLLPSIDLSAGYSGSIMDIEQNLTDGSQNNRNNIFNQGNNLGINLNWTIFNGFRMLTEYDRLKEFEKMGEISTRLSIENLMTDITAEYYNYVRQNLRLKNLEYAVSLSRERLRIVEAEYNIGFRSRLDFLQANVYFNADSSNLIKQYEVVNTSAIQLNQLMALEDVSRQFLVEDTLITANLLMDENSLWQKTQEANARLLLSAKNKRLSELDLKTYQARNFPYLRLNGGYGYTSNLYDLSGSTSTVEKQSNLGFNYGLTLGFTLFDGMNRKREQKNAKIAIQNRELEYEQMELSLKANLANMWMAYQNNIKLLKLERDNLEVARQNYEIAIDRYRLGDLAGIELREAQNSLLEAEERLLQAQYSTKLCEISLLQISGQITSYLE